MNGSGKGETPMGAKTSSKYFHSFCKITCWRFKKPVGKEFETSPETGACRACNQYHLAAEQ
jgi:hypothetical protein